MLIDNSQVTLNDSQIQHKEPLTGEALGLNNLVDAKVFALDGNYSLQLTNVKINDRVMDMCYDSGEE